jgi:phosphogluconate dehydratase
VHEPFDASGGIKVLRSNLGRAIIKVSAVKPQHCPSCTSSRRRGGPLALLRDGDVVRLDADTASLEALVSAEEWAARQTAASAASATSGASAASIGSAATTNIAAPAAADFGSGRELFAAFRAHVSSAEAGASLLQ